MENWTERQRKRFARRIANARIANELTQYALAQKLGMTQGGYAHLELGDNLPSLETFTKLCRILDLNPVELLK